MDMEIKENCVVKGHKICQTKDATWLCLNNIYMKFHRPNSYDIGGTSVGEAADFWFIMETEKEGNVFLLHIFIITRRENTFHIYISSTNEISYNKKHNIAVLSSELDKYCVKNIKDLSQNYLCTYSFTDIDVDFLKKIDLYIPISFCNTEENSVMDSMAPTHDFQALLNDPVGADFVIESSDGTKFKTHKILLTSLCEVFKAMLREDTAESLNSYVKLVDVNKEDLSCILEFLYTGTVKDVENNNFFNLLMLADRYDLKGLKELSEYVLSNQLSSDNVLEILAAADLYNSQNLKATSLKFLKVNPTAIQSSMFEELKNVELIQQLCQFISPQ